jgi:hypothetical protein
MRNIGTNASKLTAGSSNAMLYFCNDAGNSYNLQFKRIYMDLIATTFFNCVNSTKKVEIANCEGNVTAYKALVAGALDMEVKNCGILGTGFGVVPASLLSIYGSMFAHIFTSATAGRLQLLFNEDSAANAAYITKNFTTSATGTSGFNSGGGVALINSGDYIICEFPWKIIGIDTFNSGAVTITTSTNMTIEYAINTGSGYGAWTAFTGANLNTETVDEVAGFYFKIKCSANATNAANLLTRISCLTDSNSTAQGLQYPLDVNTLTLTGLVTGSDVTITTSDTNTVVGSIAQTTPTSWAYVYSGAQTVDIKIIKAGYEVYTVYDLALTTTDSSLPIAQRIDRAYV